MLGTVGVVILLLTCRAQSTRKPQIDRQIWPKYSPKKAMDEIDNFKFDVSEMFQLWFFLTSLNETQEVHPERDNNGNILSFREERWNSDDNESCESRWYAIDSVSIGDHMRKQRDTKGKFREVYPQGVPSNNRMILNGIVHSLPLAVKSLSISSRLRAVYMIYLESPLMTRGYLIDQSFSGFSQ